MRSRRLLAALSLALLAIVEFAPHHHDDASFDLAADSVTSAIEIHDTNCSNPNSKSGHLHRDSVREVDPCVACLRQHVQITRALANQGAPHIAVQPALTIARIARTCAAHPTSSSRAPPALFS
jgi:hypothetical protein